jgi:hypothetical protein
MSQDLIKVVNIIDSLATMVSEIRMRQMHSSPDRECDEIKPIKAALSELRDKLERQL